MVQLTSAEAAKILKKLNEELSSVMRKEEQSKDFLAAMGEDPETVRPKYDYEDTSKKIDEIETKIRLGVISNKSRNEWYWSLPDE